MSNLFCVNTHQMILKIYFKVYYLPYSRIFFHITIPRNLTYSPQATCITAYTCRQSPWIPIKEKCILPIPCYIWYITEYYFKFLFHAFNAQICWSKRYFYLIATEMAVFYLCFFLFYNQTITWNHYFWYKTCIHL